MHCISLRRDIQYLFNISIPFQFLINILRVIQYSLNFPTFNKYYIIQVVYQPRNNLNKLSPQNYNLNYVAYIINNSTRQLTLRDFIIIILDISCGISLQSNKKC